jgi:hypothetical protein
VPIDFVMFNTDTLVRGYFLEEYDFFYFLDQPDDGNKQAETHNWLYLINKSCVLD